jgi:hypothetical protein
MNRLAVVGALCVAAIAAAQPKGNCVRLGTPIAVPPNAVSTSVDADQPPSRQSTPDTAVLDVQVPKMYFDAGEPVVLTTLLHTKGGAPLDGGQMDVEDQVVSGPLDHDEQPKGRKYGKATGKGQHQAALDNSPGEHHVIVSRDAVGAHGNSVHRAVAATYVVATGEITFLDVTSVHPVGNLLVVALKARSPEGGIFTITATIASGPIAVARAGTLATVPPGVSTVELPFEQQDIVEPGPYRLVDVTATGGNGTGLAAAPHNVGGPFQAAHADHEPEPARNEEGALVGGPYGPGPDFSQPPPTPEIVEPAPVVIPRWPEGEPVDLSDGPPPPPKPGPQVLQ